MADLYIIATIVSKADTVDALRAALLPATEKFRQEDGCLGYTLLEDRKRPGRFITYERWRDSAALEAHIVVANNGSDEATSPRTSGRRHDAGFPRRPPDPLRLPLIMAG